MAGQEVTRNDLDMKMAQSIVGARDAITTLETINGFLARTPVGADGVDQLTVAVADGGRYGYTADEAALIRKVFGELEALKPQIDPVFQEASALTGLL